MVAIEAAKVVALMVLDFGRVASVAFGDPKPGLARSRWLGPGDPELNGQACEQNFEAASC